MQLKYKMCAGQDARKMFEYAAGRFWNLPVGVPDERMATHPIWSTWAQYKTHINESVVLQFAQDIIDNGFDNSQLEIDDNWESCYGDAKFDEEKFPDPARYEKHPLYSSLSRALQNGVQGQRSGFQS